MSGRMPVVSVSRDAFGRALLDFHQGRPGFPLILERDDGWSGPALQPAEFFAPYEAWALVGATCDGSCRWFCA